MFASRRVSTFGSVMFPLMMMWIAHFCVDFLVGIWAIYKSIAAIDLAQAGLITAICVTLGEGCQLLFSPLADRGYQKYLLFFGVLSSCAALLLPLTSSLIICSLLCLSVSIGSAAFHPPAAGFMGSFSKKKKGLLLTFFWSGGALGMAVSHLSFAKALDIFGGHALPLFAVPFLVLFGFLPLTFPPQSQTSSTGGTARFRKLFQFFKRRHLRLLYITQVGTQIVFWSTIFILPDVLLAKNAESWIAFGGGHLAFMMGGVLMMVPIGLLADRFSARRTILIAIVISFFAFYSFLLLPSLSTHTTLLLLFFLGGAMGVLNPLGITIGNHLVPESPAMISAFLMGMVWCVTESFGPGGIGLLTKLFQEQAAVKSLMLMGLFLLASLYCAWLLPQQKEEPLELNLAA